MTTRAVRITCGLALGLLPLAALAQTQPTQTPPTQAPHPATPPSSADMQFIDQATRAGLAEVEEGRLAEKDAHRASVRNLARTMVRDHEWINQKLALVAQTMKVTPPSAPDEQQTQMIDELRHRHGSSFDRHYLDQQATAHEQAVELFRTESEQGTDPNLKHLASVALPRLQEHLQMVEKLGGHPATS